MCNFPLKYFFLSLQSIQGKSATSNPNKCFFFFLSNFSTTSHTLGTLYPKSRFAGLLASLVGDWGLRDFLVFVICCHHHFTFSVWPPVQTLFKFISRKFNIFIHFLFQLSNGCGISFFHFLYDFLIYTFIPEVCPTLFWTLLYFISLFSFSSYLFYWILGQ